MRPTHRPPHPSLSHIEGVVEGTGVWVGRGTPTVDSCRHRVFFIAVCTATISSYKCSLQRRCSSCPFKSIILSSRLVKFWAGYMPPVPAPAITLRGKQRVVGPCMSVRQERWVPLFLVRWHWRNFLLLSALQHMADIVIIIKPMHGHVW
jgi:hypothetical protein